MIVLKSVVSTFALIFVLLMISPLSKAKDRATVVGLTSLIVVYLALVLLVWMG